jgi:beta-N-acetylhexosaminidase
MIDLKGKPFFLNDEDIRWVRDTLAGMTLDQKVGQLFCLVSYTGDENAMKKLVRDYMPGGLMCRPMPAVEVVSNVCVLQSNAAIPMLISANLERGGVGIIEEGTCIGSQLQVAATDDDSMAYRLGLVCGREGAAVGANWAFAPIIDIDYNFRNPITNSRTFGSDPERVRRMGAQYVKGVQECGVAASIKHFPGDGMDERDQHLVTSINSLSCEDWDATYGAAYRAGIEAGALTVMVGHIMQPAYTRRLNPSVADRDILPASLSYELMTQLLRGQLGFNGLIVTDATTMAGMTIPMPRVQAVPLAIAAGADMFLFTRNIDEDYGYMRKGIADGVITSARLEEALIRILALKAALKLHCKKAGGTLLPTQENALHIAAALEHKAWAKECADKSITLVKREDGVLPLTLEKYRKVLLYSLESGQGFAYTVRAGVAEMFRAKLEKVGFDIDVFNADSAMEGRLAPYSDTAEKYDLIIYLANLKTKSNQTVVRIEWAQPMGVNVPIFMTSVPTVFISVENPYHLLDVPRVRTYINTYYSNDEAMDSLVEKLTGKSAFAGKSPVDPFCGMWDTRL